MTDTQVIDQSGQDVEASQPIPMDRAMVLAEIMTLEQQMKDTNAWAKNVAAHARYRDLVRAIENDTTPSRPTKINMARAGRKRELEAEIADKKLGWDFNGYWRNPAKQAEYRAILEAEERGQAAGPFDDADAGEVSAEDFESRAMAIEEEVGDATELVASLEGLPEPARCAAWQILAYPKSRLQILDRLDDDDFEDLMFFVDAMPKREWQAVCRQLGLSS